MKREELLINAKPILFNTEMVKAILDDRKTVTRRVVKVENDSEYMDIINTFGSNENLNSAVFIYFKSWNLNTPSEGETVYRYTEVKLPYQEGDILYVRETFDEYTGGYCYKADWQGVVGKWKPSIHMPKAAARLFLKVTNVRVERLHEINKEDYVKEGITNNFIEHMYTSVMDWMILWDSTIKEKDLDKYGWKANPYVWVIEFERVEVEV